MASEGRAISLLLLWTFVGSAHCLLCECKITRGGVRLPPPVECGTNHTCIIADGENAACYREIVLLSSGQIEDKYTCIYGQHGVDPTIAVCNSTVTPQIACCSDRDYCNRDLQVSLLDGVASSSPMPEQTPSPTPAHRDQEHSSLNAGLVAAIVVPTACTIVALTIIVFALLIVCYLRKRKVKQETTRRRATTGMMEMNSSGKMDLIDMTVTSGSGSGLPFLIQRTVARTIKITEPIGTGRYGQVFLGYYQGEPVAVKKFASRDERSWVRETEIYNTLLLRHDNILGFFASDMVSNNGVTELWLITQYHQFGSLYDFLNLKVLSPKVMLQMTISTCSGLAHLHTELYGTQAKPAIAHRDIKSKNILVKNNMTCCVADFGLAVFKDHNEMNMPTNPKQGTKRYMAPEILNETINSKSFESFKQVDIYALGLVMWEICRRCTGHSGAAEEYEVPFQGLVPPDPSFEDMRRVVAVERRQPPIPTRWNSEELLREMTKVMRECWYYISTARPTAVYLKKKLLKMSQELEKMNYIEHDVCEST